MSLGSLTLLISRECDTYYKKRDSKKLNHRVDALRYLHFHLFVKERGRLCARAISIAFAWNALLITRAAEPPEGLVEPIGIEPMTSCLQSRRSPS